MSREIKFRIIHKNKIVGYEHLTENGWRWNWIELNPDKGESWHQGVVHDSTPKAMVRCQYTVLKDKNAKEAYYGDIIEFETTEGSILRKELSWSDELQCTMVGNMPYHQLYESGYIQPSKIVFLIVGNIYENPELLKP